MQAARGVQLGPDRTDTTEVRIFRSIVPVALVTAAMVGSSVAPAAGAGSAPAAPTGVVAVAGASTASVSWTPPVSDGGSPILGYRVTASPGGAVCDAVAPATSCAIAPLADRVTVTFTVRASNANGWGPASSPSGPVTPDEPGSAFTSVVPFRLLDSRTAVGGWGSTPLLAGSPRSLAVGGAGPLPADAMAVVMNVTVTGSTAASYLTVYPAGTAAPTAANLNFGVAQTIPNLVVAKLGTSGQVMVATAHGAVHVVADVLGYFAAPGSGGDPFTATGPTRILDSRTATGGWSGALGAGTGAARDLHVAGVGGVPGTASSVALSVTATGATENTWLQVAPKGAAPPTPTANLNVGRGQTIANLVVVKVGTGGDVRFVNAAGSVHVVADVVGWFGPTGSSSFHPMAPTRILDDRSGVGLSGPWTAGQSRALVVGGVMGISQGATGVVMNTTATGATAGSYLTVYPDGVPRPTAANLSFGPSQTIPVLVMARVPVGRKIAVYNQLGSVDVVGDVAGYFAPTGPGSPSCELTPADSFWHARVTALPVHPSSATWIATAGAGSGLKADFGSGTWAGGPIGIPFDVVDRTQPKVPMTFGYANESDPGPYPFPTNASIEGGPASSGDRHVIVVDRDACRLYETWDSHPNADGSWHAGSGAVFDLRSNAMRPAGWTSADAAGLPILPGLVQYDEVARGEVGHVIRMTVPSTQNAYVWPASHKAGSAGTSTMPMGTWLRLKASVDPTAFDVAVRPIIVALQTHGAVIADNGSAWYMSGVPDPRWNNAKLATLGQLKGSDFEVVDATSLQVAPGSYQAAVAG